MPKPDSHTTEPTFAELKSFIREVRKFRVFESYQRNRDVMHKVLDWLKEKTRGN